VAMTRRSSGGERGVGGAHVRVSRTRRRGRGCRFRAKEITLEERGSLVAVG